MKELKEAGIKYIQVTVNEWFDQEGSFKKAYDTIKEELLQAKIAAQKGGIVVEGIHMPFGRFIDLSLTDEASRKNVISLHKKVLELCQVLKPGIILFHPSWFLNPGNREAHINQLIRSVTELEKTVSNMGAVITIENMTGPEPYLTRNGVTYERPLCSTNEEMLQVLNLLPSNVYAAVDMNHILLPDRLILALGKRLKAIHIADGDGVRELHYYPCSGKGKNNWTSILDALYKVKYAGPFMFECKYNDPKDLFVCYQYLYQKFIIEKYIQPEYQ
ncbi:MAG: sugar phosphate isomerase/epimerase [Sphingobacteriales bacterium]|nr:sugar phosphate isomerase/epimerase [Sphingobacteriales bacterium]